MLHILRPTTLFLRLVCHSVPLNLWPQCQQKVFQKRRKSPWKNGRTLQTREAEPFEGRQRNTKQALFHQLCTRRQKLSFPDSCAKSSTASVSNESVPLSTSSACTVVTFASDEKIPQVLIGTKPEPFQMDEFESDYDETESEEIVEHRNAITRSGRQIASVRFDRWWKCLYDPNTSTHTSTSDHTRLLVEQALNTSSAWISMGIDFSFHWRDNRTFDCYYVSSKKKVNITVKINTK